VELAVEELKEKSVELGFRIINKQTADLLATGYLVVEAADRQTGKAVQIPREIADKLQPFVRT
jgi:acyl-CoA thioesterase FadM